MYFETTYYRTWSAGKSSKNKSGCIRFFVLSPQGIAGAPFPQLNLAEPPLLNLVSLDSLKKTVRVVKVIYLFGTKEKFRIYFLFHGVPYLYVYE